MSTRTGSEGPKRGHLPDYDTNKDNANAIFFQGDKTNAKTNICVFVLSVWGEQKIYLYVHVLYGMLLKGMIESSLKY